MVPIHQKMFTTAKAISWGEVGRVILWGMVAFAYCLAMAGTLVHFFGR